MYSACLLQHACVSERRRRGGRKERKEGGRKEGRESVLRHQCCRQHMHCMMSPVTLCTAWSQPCARQNRGGRLSVSPVDDDGKYVWEEEEERRILFNANSSMAKTRQSSSVSVSSVNRCHLLPACRVIERRRRGIVILLCYR